VDAAFTQAATHMATASCHNQATCGPFWFQAQYGDEATCVSATVSLLSVELTAPNSGVTTAGVEACAGLLDAAPDCNPSAEIVRACNFVGTEPAGSPCFVSTQCTAGFCLETGDVVGCGTCASTVPDGQSCAPPKETDCDIYSPCVTGADGGATCQPFAFVPQPAPLELGESCSARNGAACDDGQGLYCDGSSGTCVAMKTAKAGEPCGDPRTLCIGNGAVCDPKTNRCAAGVDLGGACDGVSVACKQPGDCVDGTCQLPGSAHCG
jgi:hypothetical protein